jgi:hypothetical protein
MKANKVFLNKYSNLRLVQECAEGHVKKVIRSAKKITTTAPLFSVPRRGK